MHKRLVLCGGVKQRGTRPRGALSLAILGSHSNIQLRLDDISRRMVANAPDLLTDLVEIGSYVLCADEAVSRGGDARIALGANWRRQFRFVIPVRSPDHWSSSAVTGALTDVLSFLSDDQFQFEFVKYTHAPPFQTYLGLTGKGAATFEADEVMLFSGGLDSLAGAIDELDLQRHRVALVSHHSSPKMHSRQCHLAGELAKRCPGRVMHFPILMTKRNTLTAPENTQRTRVFLFAALAMAVAMMGRRRIRFYENGIVSFNLPIAGQVVGTQATRTTHPRVIRDLARFLSVLLKDEVVVDNPFVWKTKAEVARLIAVSAHADLARRSVSCSDVHGMTILHPHCGKCFQCLDRRFAALDADLGEDDPAEMYRVQLLTGDREQGDQRTMAEAYVRRALEFRRITEAGFLGQCVGEISRGMFAFPGMSPDEVARFAFRLHKRHGDSVYAVLTKAVRTHADDLVSGTLPPNCILRMAVGAYGRDFDDAAIDAASVGGPADDQAPDGRNYRQTTDIRLAIGKEAQQVLIHGLPPIEGKANHGLVSALLAKYDADLRERRAPERYRYTVARSLATELAIDEQTLRRRVSRLRRKLAALCVDYLGFPLQQDAIIETKGWHGYRINPTVRVVASAEIEVARHSSSAGKSHDRAPEPVKSAI